MASKTTNNITNACDAMMRLVPELETKVSLAGAGSVRRIGDVWYEFPEMTQMACAGPMVRVADETKPNPEYENHGGAWEFAEIEQSRGSGPGYEFRPSFSPQEEDKTYVRCGRYGEMKRFRKHRVLCADGTHKNYAFKEQRGMKEMLTPLKTDEQIQAWITEHRHRRYQQGRYYLGNYAILNTDIPKTIHTTIDCQFRWCVAKVSDLSVAPEGRAPLLINTRQQTILMLQRTRTRNGLERTSLYPLYIALGEFSTRHSAVPLFGCEAMEHLRSHAGTLKQDLVERVFAPDRVVRMAKAAGMEMWEWMDSV